MYREVRPSPAVSQPYVTRGPEDIYETRTPQNFAQYGQRLPMNTSEAYVIRDGPQYQARQPPKIDHVLTTPAAVSGTSNIEYAVKNPVGIVAKEEYKEFHKRMAYVESVANSDEESDDNDRLLRRKSSAKVTAAEEHQSAVFATAPMVPQANETYAPLQHFPTAPAELSAKPRRPASISGSSHDMRPGVSPLQFRGTVNSSNSTESIGHGRRRHHSLQAGSSVPRIEYSTVDHQLPSISNLASDIRQPQTPPSPYSDNTYREVQPVERRRSSSHRQSIGAASPRSPNLPPSARSASYGFSQVLIEGQEAEPRKLAPLAEGDTEIPRTEKQTSSDGLGIQFVEVKPAENIRRGMSVSEKRSKPLAITYGSGETSPPTGNQFLMASNSGLLAKRRASTSVLPPPSPLLEAYKGTYQSISPMPSPIMDPVVGPLEDFPPLSPTVSTTTSDSGSRLSRTRSKSSSSRSKHAKIYDAAADAETLLAALNHHSGAKSGPLVTILPKLSHDQFLELRSEYKRRYKVAGHGVNIAKHIKNKTSGNFGKVCYVVALGRWESESYWANFWYQSQEANRELLIEALMGRPNAEVRAIKDSFRDKRYNDSLVRCMEKELKADKFRKGVLMALEEKRQEETEILSLELRNRDVEALNKAILSKDSGESAIISIVICRSDTHMREVLKAYESTYGKNFAKEALKKSNNLVGELLAHVLNGIINRPLRDAMLLHHAITDVSTHNSAVQLRHELLISRLVRIHWDRVHLIRVREEYAKRYGEGYPSALELDVSKACKGEYGDFCVRLCEI